MKKAKKQAAEATNSAAAAYKLKNGGRHRCYFCRVAIESPRGRPTIA